MQAANTIQGVAGWVRILGLARVLLIGALVMATALTAGMARADQQSARPIDPAKATNTLAEAYCLAVREKALEIRYAFQIEQLKTLRTEIDRQLGELEKRAEEVKVWLAKREEFSKRANEQLVGIYATMRPDAAAEQLVNLQDVTAAAIVVALDARVAGAILSEMPADRAARLAAIVAGAARKSTSRSGS